MFIWAQPTFFLLGLAHARPRAADMPDPPVSGTAARRCVAAYLSAPPPHLCSAGSTSTAHGARAHRIRAVAGQALLTGWQGPPHCSCPASSTHQPRRTTPTAPLPHPPPFKKGPDDAVVPRPPFLSRVLTPSTPRQTSSPSVRPALGAPLFLTRILAAVLPSFTC
jgi:hypothetical protein